MAAHNDYGAAGEDAAAALLESTGWKLLARNWRSGRRELDLVARRGRVVAFIEVRARASTAYGHPLETIGWRKRVQLESAARAWIVHHGQPAEVYRFDVVSVVGTGPAAAMEVEHLEDAWRL
jgi:putative endonuclease